MSSIDINIDIKTIRMYEEKETREKKKKQMNKKEGEITFFRFLQQFQIQIKKKRTLFHKLSILSWKLYTWYRGIYV